MRINYNKVKLLSNNSIYDKKVKRINNMNKKALVLTIIGVVLTSFLWLFFTSKTNHNIPMGEYIETDYGTDTFVLRGDNNYDYFWVIKKDTANYYASGVLTYKCDIIIDDNQMYLKGRTWFDLVFWREKGEVFLYEITYDAQDGTFTIIDSSR